MTETGRNEYERIDNTYGFGQQEYQQRSQLHDQACNRKNSLFWTYKRMFVAAEWVGRFGWGLDLFTAIIGSVLLYALTREGSPTNQLLNSLIEFAPADLAIIILVGSLLSAFYGPKLRSRVYYNAGQEIQELHDQLDDFIEMEIIDQESEFDDLKQKYQRLNRRRHRLNQSTPQLGGYWYRLMKAKEKYQKTVPWEEYSEYEEETFEEKIKRLNGEGSENDS
ncbi:hypothetical protein ACFO0N_15040 [Halobium salinum]|uniref:SMODS and SLOG-associating 2TM effector domain-containing protein n=1 Tax=Halobium salinum TaxID=1364940 RepID=A0ABD5PF32_9EURY|nr:hypothetical protein [Halobium salinum]